jgi:hypothetical protein
VFGNSMRNLIEMVDWTVALERIAAKQAINAKRKWPAPGGENEPVEHIRETEAA